MKLFNKKRNVTIRYSMAIHISVPSKKATYYPTHRICLITASRKHGSSMPSHVDNHLCTEPPPNRFNELQSLVRISDTVKKLRPWRRCVMCCKAVRKRLIHCCPNCRTAFAYMSDSRVITKTPTVKFASWSSCQQFAQIMRYNYK